MRRPLRKRQPLPIASSGGGYGTLWIPEAFGNPLVKAAWLLTQTTRLMLATEIVNIYAGADQVCVQVVAREGLGLTERDEEILAILAPTQH